MEFPGENESVRKRTETLEFRKGESPTFIPMHRSMHPEIPIVAPYGARRLSRIEFNGIEALRFASLTPEKIRRQPLAHLESRLKQVLGRSEHAK